MSTHTDAKWGKLEDRFFAENVRINFEGENFIIAHLKVGNIHIAIGQEILVTPKKSEALRINPTFSIHSLSL